MTEAASHAADKPVWRKIWEFPLTALVVALALLVATMAATSFALDHLPDTLGRNLDASIRAIVAVVAVFAIYKLAIRHLGGRKHDDLPLSGALVDTGLGIGVGAAIFTTVVGVAAVAGVYRIVGSGGWSDFIEIVMATGIVAGFIEEVIFRGILFRWIEEFAGSLVALIISSLAFGLLHWGNENATLFSSLAIAVEAGILLGAAYMLTRSLWLAIGIHAGWNVTQGFIWGVPVSGYEFEGLVQGQLYGPSWLSGGAFGLEASVIALVVATSAGIWLVRQAYKEGHWFPPMWKRG